MANSERMRITREQLATQFKTRRGTGLSVGTEFSVKFDGDEPCVIVDRFESDGEEIEFPAFVIVVGEREKSIALTSFCTKAYSAFAKADDERQSEILAQGLCAEDAVYLDIYDAVKSAGKDKKYKMGGKKYFSVKDRRAMWAKAANIA